jgi:hypothetical protein
MHAAALEQAEVRVAAPQAESNRPLSGPPHPHDDLVIEVEDEALRSNPRLGAAYSASRGTGRGGRA